MPRFRKSKLPTDISALTLTSPTELVQNLTSRRDLRTVAASSTVIALSICSPFHNAHDTSSEGATAPGRDTGWRATYAAVRMAVEVTKESSDLFPPLKAVVGAMSLLMKNYDVGVSRSRNERLLILFPAQQTSDNAENVGEIERRVHSPPGVLASPASKDDCAEKWRRAELRRSVRMRIYVSFLTPPAGSSRGLPRSSNHSPTKIRLLSSYAMSITPKP